MIEKGAGLYFAGFGISKVLALIFIVMLSRSLQPEVFGIYSVGVIISVPFQKAGFYLSIIDAMASTVAWLAVPFNSSQS